MTPAAAAPGVGAADAVIAATGLPFRYDDSDVATAGQVVGITQQIVESVGNRIAKVQPKLGIAPRGVKGAGLDYLGFLGPGIVALSIMQTAIFGVGGPIVTYKEKGVLPLCFVSLGFTIAAVSKNIEVVQALMNLVQTPMMFLSGIFFPMNNAPAWIQPIVKLLPLTYLADALRSVIIDGAGLWAVRWDLVILLAVTGVFVLVAWRFFRWE